MSPDLVSVMSLSLVFVFWFSSFLLLLMLLLMLSRCGVCSGSGPGDESFGGGLHKKDRQVSSHHIFFLFVMVLTLLESKVWDVHWVPLLVCCKAINIR